MTWRGRIILVLNLFVGLTITGIIVAVALGKGKDPALVGRTVASGLGTLALLLILRWMVKRANRRADVAGTKP